MLKLRCALCAARSDLTFNLLALFFCSTFSLFTVPAYSANDPAPENGGLIRENAGSCGILDTASNIEGRRNKSIKTVWIGPCVAGLANGEGVRKYYHEGVAFAIHRQSFSNGRKVGETREAYLRRTGSGAVHYKPDTGEVIVAAADVPSWAREILDPIPGTSAQTAAEVSNKDRIENKPGQPIKAGVNPPPGNGGAIPSKQTGGGPPTGTSQVSSSGSTDYRNYIGWITSSTSIFAAPYVVSDQGMLRSLVGQFRELLAGNPTESALRTVDCPRTFGSGPYVALAHFQNPGGQSGVGVGCGGGNTPEEAYRATCGSGGPGCTGSMSGREFAKYIIIVDRRIAVGKSTYAEPAVGVVTQEATFKYRPGEKVSFSEKYNFSEGYVCHWGKDPYGKRFQMVTNGPFTADFSMPRGRYEFNCGSKG